MVNNFDQCALLTSFKLSFYTIFRRKNIYKCIRGQKAKISSSVSLFAKIRYYLIHTLEMLKLEFRFELTRLTKLVLSVLVCMFPLKKLSLNFAKS